MTRIVTFGEVMLRLKSPGFERLLQSPVLEATYGGAEANVAVSLAQFGLPVSFVTALPSNPPGESAIGEIRKFGVDTSFIKRAGDRMGIYFLESGSNQRASKITYDRAGSSMAAAKPGDFDWSAVLEGASWFHISGVTPAISASAAALSLEAVKSARAKGFTVSCDYNYRKNLWRYGKKAPEVMREIVSHATIGIANEEDARWFASKLVLHPLKSFEDPVRLSSEAAKSLPHTYIACTDNPALAPVFRPFAERARTEEGWGYRELPTGHAAMITMPQELSDLLVGVV